MYISSPKLSWIMLFWMVMPFEAAQYQEFVKDYNQYWKEYFDPIVVRLQITPERYRLETIVLPLIIAL